VPHRSRFGQSHGLGMRRRIQRQFQFGGLGAGRVEHLATLLEQARMLAAGRLLLAQSPGLGRLCVRHQRGGGLLAFGHNFCDRPKQKPRQQPDQNQHVDTLQAQGPPIDMHDGGAYLINGLANNTSKAITRQ
jgi:hypothetical protein